jgi:putative membrane protein
MTTKCLECSIVAVAAFSLASFVYAQAPASDADTAFVGKVSQGGLYEVLSSRYAATKATAPDVRDLALAEVHDHELVNSNLKRVAAATHVTVAPGLNAEFTDRLARLKAVPAADFDAAYIADMQTIHDKDEKLFAQEATDGSDAYKTFAHQTDLIVKRHIGALHGLDN